MPLYDYVCRTCEERFEARSDPDQPVNCPECGAPEAQRRPSGFAGPFTVGLRGAAAKKSNAQRRVREELRRERREVRKTQEK
jgi:putative FmdB family regulatory protein